MILWFIIFVIHATHNCIILELKFVIGSGRAHASLGENWSRLLDRVSEGGGWKSASGIRRLWTRHDKVHQQELWQHQTAWWGAVLSRVSLFLQILEKSWSLEKNAPTFFLEVLRFVELKERPKQMHEDLFCWLYIDRRSVKLVPHFCCVLLHRCSLGLQAEFRLFCVVCRTWT